MKRKTHEEVEKPANLIVSKDEAKRKIQAQIDEGESLLAMPINTAQDLDNLKSKQREWNEYNAELLLGLFDTDKINKEYLFDRDLSWLTSSVVDGPPPIEVDNNYIQNNIKSLLVKLRSILRRLDLYPEPMGEKDSSTQCSCR